MVPMIRKMKSFLFFIVLMMFAVSEVKADDMPPDTLSGWALNWVASLNGSQATYSNWSRGGVSSMSLTSMSTIRMFYRKDEFSYEFRIDTRYGQARIQDEGIRKTDDRLVLRNRFLYDISDGDTEFRLFTHINFESQFSPGFSYGAGPEGEDILRSDFMSPAYFTQNAGLSYYPQERFSIDAGLGLKQTVVLDTTLSARYGVDEGRRIKPEAGFTIGVDYEQEIMEDVIYEGHLETFTNLVRPIRRTDIFFTNKITGKVNNHINVQFRFELIYDDDFSEKLQVSQVLSAGVSVNLR